MSLPSVRTVKNQDIQFAFHSLLRYYFRGSDFFLSIECACTASQETPVSSQIIFCAPATCWVFYFSSGSKQSQSCTCLILGPDNSAFRASPLWFPLTGPCFGDRSVLLPLCNLLPYYDFYYGFRNYIQRSLGLVAERSSTSQSAYCGWTRPLVTTFEYGSAFKLLFLILIVLILPFIYFIYFVPSCRLSFLTSAA